MARASAQVPGTGPRPFWLAAAGFLGLAALAYALFVLNPLGQELENLALFGARDEFRELRADSLQDLHHVAAFGFALAIGVVLLVAILRRKPVLAFAAASVIGGSAIAAELAKRILVRPELIESPSSWLSNSFPSGHVTVAVAIGVGAVLVVPYRHRALATLLAAVYAIGVAQAVGVAGWHRLSDVVGAAFLALAVASAVVALLAVGGHVRPFRGRGRIGFLLAALILGGLGLILTAAGTLFGLARLWPVPESPTADHLTLAYTTTLVVGAGVIALAFLAFLALIRPFIIDEPAAPVTPAEG